MVNGMELGEVIGKDFFDLCVALSMGEQFIADIGNDFRVFGKKRHLFGDFLFVGEVGEVIDEVFQFKAVLDVLQVHGCFLWVGMKSVKGGDGFFDNPAIAVFAEGDGLLQLPGMMRTPDIGINEIARDECRMVACDL